MIAYIIEIINLKFPNIGLHEFEPGHSIEFHEYLHPVGHGIVLKPF